MAPDACAACSCACSEDILKKSENIARDNLATVGVCFGKFTKTRKFKLHVTALDYLAQYAKVCRPFCMQHLIPPCH